MGQIKPYEDGGGEREQGREERKWWKQKAKKQGGGVVKHVYPSPIYKYKQHSPGHLTSLSLGTEDGGFCCNQTKHSFAFTSTTKYFL